VFGLGKRSSPPPAPSATSASPEPKGAGKGRPTPTRREAEQRHRTPLISSTRQTVPKGATKEERKAAKQASREAVRAERQRSRAALFSGDERFLPDRDRGPARRFVRNYVDARRNPGEYFMPVALVAVLLGLVGIPTVVLASTLTLYAAVVVVATDSVLLRRRVNRLVAAKFGSQEVPKVGTYAMMRALQIRRSRLPRPQVERGQYPT
jgi:hypothetical protein